jgi:hypothetical protein
MASSPDWWSQVGAHLRGRMIEDFYASLVQEGRSHEESMALARAAAGMSGRATDPMTIQPMGSVNAAVLESHGVAFPRRQGPAAAPPRRSVVAALRAMDAAPVEAPPPAKPPLRSNSLEQQLAQELFTRGGAGSGGGPWSSPGPERARMAGQLLAAVLAGAGGLIGAGLSMEGA